MYQFFRHESDGNQCAHKARFVGTHFWNPATLIPLVEVIKAKDSSEETVQAIYGLLADVGKQPIICQKDGPGIVANRLQHALWREAVYIVEQGIADAETVDKAVKYSFGLRLPHCRLSPVSRVLPALRLPMYLSDLMQVNRTTKKCRRQF